MALFSPSKQSDLESIVILSDIIEIIFRIYKKNPNEELKESLERFIKTYEELKHRTDTHDYSKEDASYWRFEAILERNKLSPDASLMT
jgi:hypothetical protein